MIATRHSTSGTEANVTTSVGVTPNSMADISRLKASATDQADADARQGHARAIAQYRASRRHLSERPAPCGCPPRGSAVLQRKTARHRSRGWPATVRRRRRSKTAAWRNAGGQSNQPPDAASTACRRQPSGCPVASGSGECSEKRIPDRPRRPPGRRREYRLQPAA